jgi:DNA-binding NtrC family response regulator
MTSDDRPGHAAPEAPDRAPGTPHPSRLPSGLRVLAVEDETLIALDLEDMLRAAGAGAVIHARSLAEVEAAIAGDGTIDVAIINLDPSAAAGADLGPARAVQAAGIPFLFATGADGGSAPDFSEAVFVDKPYRRETIVTAVLATLAAPVR